MFEMLDHNGACHFGSSFALGSLNPICVKNPPTHTKVGGHGGRAVAKLQKPLAAILVGKEIPWATHTALGASGYVTVEDLADRWNTPTAARENGPRNLGFQDGENGFNAQTSAFTAMRLLQAVRVAGNLVRGGDQGGWQGGPDKGALGGPV